MKQLLIVSLVLLFCASNGWAQNGRSQEPASPPSAQANLDAASSELVTLTKTWTDAMNAKDHEKLEALLAPEYALYRWDGQRMAARAGWLDFLYHTDIKEYTVRDISAKAYGELGVVTLVCTWTGINNGHPFDIHSVMVDTWRRTNGTWQVVARSSCTPTPQTAGTASPCTQHAYSDK
jgi:ketosteroid isomerase-like protein